MKKTKSIPIYFTYLELLLLKREAKREGVSLNKLLSLSLNALIKSKKAVKK